MLTSDPGPVPGGGEALEAHLSACEACRAEYQRAEVCLGLVKQYGELSPDTAHLIEASSLAVSHHLRPIPGEELEISDARVEAGLARLMARIDLQEQARGPHRPMLLEEGVADLRRRVNTIEAYQAELWEGRQRTPAGPTPADSLARGGWSRKLRFASGIAAGLTAVLVLGWMSLSPVQHGNLAQIDPDPASPPVLWITADGMQPIPVGEPIHSGDEHRELLLGGLHRVIMNTDTSATVQAQDGAFSIGLTQGEMYIEVVPGAARNFEVTTHNARLTITGTKFNVTADDRQTELILLKGSVRFASLTSHDPVDVLAGHASRVIGYDAPTRPHPVNAQAATAWTHPAVGGEALTHLNPHAGPYDMAGLSEEVGAADLPDYRTWSYERFRDEQRDWFAKQFPWVMSLEKTLQEDHGIKADYLDILVISGDIWQFGYAGSERTGGPIAAFHPASVERLAVWYGLDADTLTRAIGYRPGSYSPADAPDGRKFKAAIERWISDLTLADHNRFTHSALNTLVLTTYLTNTRAAAQLWAIKHPEQAARLLKNDDYVNDYFAVLFPPIEPGGMAPIDLLAIQLDNQVGAGIRCRQLINEQLAAPGRVTGSTDECMLRQERFCNTLGVFNRDSKESKE